MRYDRNLMAGGAVAALSAAMLTMVWLTMLLALPALPTDAPLSDEMLFIAEHGVAYAALYIGIFVLTLVQVPLFVALTVLCYRRHGSLALVWGGLAMLYEVFSLLAYWTQLTIARGLADLFVNSETTSLQSSALASYLTWGYTGRLASAPYALDLLGTLMYSMAILGFGLMLIRERGVDLVSGGLLILSAAAGIIGVAGYLARSPLLENGVVLSGAFIMPAFFTLAYRFQREARRHSS
ncbi:MAG: hypothetical protein J7M34_01110 [Anaerolineae bacterium]|nr:hypothetical protein [Anaerolineae bacterium]